MEPTNNPLSDTLQPWQVTLEEWNGKQRVYLSDREVEKLQKLPFAEALVHKDNVIALNMRHLFDYARYEDRPTMLVYRAYNHTTLEHLSRWFFLELSRLRLTREEHKQFVVIALESGNRVPEYVLQSYPDLNPIHIPLSATEWIEISNSGNVTDNIQHEDDQFKAFVDGVESVVSFIFANMSQCVPNVAELHIGMRPFSDILRQSIVESITRGGEEYGED